MSDVSNLSMTLRSQIESLAARAPGRLSVVVVGPHGPILDLDGGRVVPAASTVKVPILVAALLRVATGERRLEDRIDLGAHRVGGSGALSLVPSVTEAPLVEILRLMIAVSDNDAANAVIAMVGIEAVGQTCRRLGLDGTRIQRSLMDDVAREAGLDNVTCARDLAQVMTRLRLGNALPLAETRLALELLAEQQFLDGLPALLPARVWHGNKTGDLTGVRHDMALFEHNGRWAAVAVTATGLGDPAEGVDRGSTVLPTFASIGAAVGNWVIGRDRRDAQLDPHRP